MSGTAVDCFAPEESVTRGMIVTVLARMNGADTGGGQFWYSKGLEWAVEHGVSDGSAPEALLSREQLITMLWRYAGHPESNANLSGFRDADKISGWAKTAIAWGVETGLLQGHNGFLDPQGATTRAQLAAIMMRFLTK